MAKKKAKEKWTEASVTRALVQRFSQKVGEYSVFPGLRNQVASMARSDRTIDLFVVRNWQPRGTTAIEIKVDRSDWLRELEDPAKSWEFDRQVNQFFVAAPADVVQLHEVPTSWGWFCMNGGGSVVVKKRPTRNDEAKMTEPLMYSLLRAAAPIEGGKAWLFQYAGKTISPDDLLKIAAERFHEELEKRVEKEILRRGDTTKATREAFFEVERLKEGLGMKWRRTKELVDLILTYWDVDVVKAVELLKSVDSHLQSAENSVAWCRKWFGEGIGKLKNLGKGETDGGAKR